MWTDPFSSIHSSHDTVFVLLLLLLLVLLLIFCSLDIIMHTHIFRFGRLPIYFCVSVWLLSFSLRTFSWIVCYHCREVVFPLLLRLLLFNRIIKKKSRTTTFNRIELFGVTVVACSVDCISFTLFSNSRSVQCLVVVSHGGNIQILSNFAYNEILTVSKHKPKNKKIGKEYKYFCFLSLSP